MEAIHYVILTDEADVVEELLSKHLLFLDSLTDLFSRECKIYAPVADAIAQKKNMRLKFAADERMADALRVLLEEANEFDVKFRWATGPGHIDYRVAYF